MFLPSKYLRIAAIVFAVTPIVSNAHCDCIDVAGIVDRGLQERAIRVVQRDSGAFRTDVKLDSVTLCDGELIFEGTLPDNRRFDVKIPAAKWEELRATITEGAMPNDKGRAKK